MKKIYRYLILLACFISIIISVCFVPISASKLIPVIEKQVEKDLGLKVHIDKLILRVGPFFKLKTPIMHIMYCDGQKFAQFNNVRFHISLLALFKDNPEIYKIRADKLTIRLASDDKYLEQLLNRLNEKKVETAPILSLNEYKISYNNKKNKNHYCIEGQDLELTKVINYRNYKIKTKGSLSVNEQKYVTYDLRIVPELEIPEVNNKYNFTEFIDQIKEIDFHSDIIADLKLYKNKANLLQASGFINIDNISVLDKQRKNPKSFIYLTLWGDKASILSNLYTSMSKKIYIEGSLNNSQKPVLDLKVKTDEVELNEVYKKIKVLTCFSKLKNISDVKGLLTANFNLKGDLNKIKSNGLLSIKDASIVSNGVLIDRINSEIDFNNNSINIVNAIGYVNNAPILVKGNIKKDVNLEFLMNKVDLKHFCSKDLGIQSGIVSLVANFKGTLDNIVHKENVQIDNFKYANINAEITFETFKIDTNKSNEAIIKNINYKNPYTELIKIPTIKFSIENDYIKLPETNIFLPNSGLTLSGNVVDLSKNLTFNTNLSGFINSKDVIALKNTTTRYPIKLNIYGNKDAQNINSQVYVENSAILEEPFILNSLTRLEKNNLKIDEISIIPYSGQDFNNYIITPKVSKKLIVSGCIDNLKKPVFRNLRIFLPQQLNLHIIDSIISLKGDAFLNGKYDSPEIIGQIFLSSLINQNLQLTVTNCVLDFNKNNIFINVPMIKLADSAINLSGNVSTDYSKGLNLSNLNIKSKYINLDTLLMYKDNLLPRNYNFGVNNSKLYIERALVNLYNNPVYITGLTSNFTVEDNKVLFKNLTTELYNGKLAGDLQYNLKDEHFTSKLMARGISASPIFALVSNKKDSISGTMDFDTELAGNLLSKQSLNGNIKFVITNGRMGRLGKLEHLLYAQNVVADSMLRTSLSVVTKAITLKDTGLFKYLRGDVDIKKGIADIKMLQSQGPLMSLFIKGYYNPQNDYGQLVVLGRLSDEIVEGLGAFGDFSLKKLKVMFTGEDTKFDMLPEDYDKIPQLAMKNTKEFRSIINGVIDKPSSVLLFNWISYTKKSLKQKDVPMTDVTVPNFVNELPY